MRNIIIVILATLSLVGMIYLINFSSRAIERQKMSASIDLVSPLQGYCPSNAELVVLSQDQVVYDGTVKIDKCAKIYLNLLGLSTGDYTLFAKTKHSLGFKKAISLPLTQSITENIAIGDMNNDNQINLTDLKIISNALDLGEPVGYKEEDLNNNSFVDTDDLGAATLGIGQGTGRPDNKEWTNR